LLGIVGFVQHKECAINDLQFFLDVLEHFIDETENNLTAVRILHAVCQAFYFINQVNLVDCLTEEKEGMRSWINYFKRIIELPLPDVAPSLRN
jgi:hypothetical protein